MPRGLGGYQPDTDSPSSRRADFDLRRRIARLEQGGGGGGGTTILDGYGPPAAELGETGNYYLDVNTDILYGPKAPAGAFVDYEINLAPTEAPNSGGYTLGVKFKVTEPSCYCTGIMFHVAATDTVLTGWTIAVYRLTDQVVIASKVVPVVKGINRITFDIPVALTPDVLYLSSVYNPPGTAFLYKANHTGPTINGPLYILKNTDHGISAGRYVDSNSYPGTDWGGSLVGTPSPLVRVTEPVWPIAMDPSGGGGGGGPTSYVHNQASPATTWLITHNLGFYPNVTVTDTAGDQVEGTITYVTLNQVRAMFTAAFAGIAYCS